MRSAQSVRNVRPRRKKATALEIKDFWTNLDSRKSARRKERPWFDQSGFWKQQPHKVNRTTMGVPRFFENQEFFFRFLARVTRLNKLIATKRFSSLEAVPTQLLSVQPSLHRVVERGYIAPNVAQIIDAESYNELSKDSLYGVHLSRKMKNKGVSFNELREAVRRAYAELFANASITKEGIDTGRGNILVLDYNPKTKKPLIVFIDHGLSDILR